jgi:hypothetical protein
MKDIYDLDYLRKLSRSIDRLLYLAELEEDSLELEDAQNRVRHQVKGICIDLNINRDFLQDFQLK